MYIHVLYLIPYARWNLWNQQPSVFLFEFRRLVLPVSCIHVDPALDGDDWRQECAQMSLPNAPEMFNRVILLVPIQNTTVGWPTKLPPSPVHIFLASSIPY